MAVAVVNGGSQVRDLPVCLLTFLHASTRSRLQFRLPSPALPVPALLAPAPAPPADMVGHTGNLVATIQACTVTDEYVKVGFCAGIMP